MGSDGNGRGLLSRVHLQKQNLVVCLHDSISTLYNFDTDNRRLVETSKQ